MSLEPTQCVAGGGCLLRGARKEGSTRHLHTSAGLSGCSELASRQSQPILEAVKQAHGANAGLGFNACVLLCPGWPCLLAGHVKHLDITMTLLRSF